MTNVKFPLFELCGPKCTVDGCDGILVTHLVNKTHKLYRKCSKCESKEPFLLNIQEENNSEESKL